MRQKIKILFVFAAVLCMAFVYAAAANADTVITADVLPETYDSVKVDFHCGATYMTSTQFYVNYDPQVLDYKSADTLSVKQGDVGIAKLVEDGKLLVSFFAAQHAFQNNMLTLHFKLKDDATSADYGFSGTFNNLYVSKDNSGADSAVADDGKLIWNVSQMTGISLTVGADSLVVREPNKEITSPDYSKVKVFGVWQNESKFEIPFDECTITTDFDGGKPGLYTVTVNYKGKEASYRVSVGIPTPESLTVKKGQSFKTEYKQNSKEELDVGNLTVIGYYPGAEVEYVTIKPNEYSVTGFNTDAAPGKQTVTISYLGKSVTLEITITPNIPDKIVIEKAPDALIYKQNAADGVSLEGIVVKAHFPDGEIKTIDIRELTTSGFNAAAEPGKQTITVTYRGKSATFDITIEPATARPTRIEIVSYPIKVAYEQSSTDSFVTTGFKVYAYYADGSEELVKVNNLNIDGFNTKVPVGKQEITVRYFDCTAKFEITIEPQDDPNIPNRIEITKNPNKVEYELGTKDEFDLTGMEAVAIFVGEDNKKREEKVDISLVKVEEFKPDKLGQLPVYISYKGYITMLSVTIVEATVKYKLGDVNANDTIGPDDARAALRYSVNLDSPTELQKLAADIDGDGIVETSDARRILRAAVGLESFE